MALKSISGYHQVGMLDQLIDIWDQPLNGLPVLFASAVWANISTAPTTSPSLVSAELGQNRAWPRTLGQDVAMVHHIITVPYTPGLLTRMFVVYNDPNSGPRRFDIDHILDPDERKFELQMLAIERKDGAAQLFDVLLNTTADVLTRDTTGNDKRGMADPTFTTIASAIPCRVASNKVVPKGKESRAKSKLTVAYREVYMRPWFQDPSPDGSYIPSWVYSGVTYNTKPLTHNHWLLIPSASVLNSKGQATPGRMYDIMSIDNPGHTHHHIELWCEVIIT